MNTPANLVLSNGSVFSGTAFGYLEPTSQGHSGEIVFNTSMTGYQEILTDPSYAGQIVIPTFPLQGNYGINDKDNESHKIQVSGFVVREQSLTPSHYDQLYTLHEALLEQQIPGLFGVDTRAVTRLIRSYGVMMGMITTEDPQTALGKLHSQPDYGTVNFVQKVTVQQPYRWNESGGTKIAIVDCGVKHNILRLLAERDCQITVMPANSTITDIQRIEPEGVLFSPGPGDPANNAQIVTTAKRVIDLFPTMGICLGHQILARAFGAKTYKLKFGHRGGNHPVQDLTTGKVHITSQNHGYAVADDRLPSELLVTHRNLNDGTIEGLRHREKRVLTIQYHSEASPGPLDNEYVFDEFIAMVKNH